MTDVARLIKQFCLEPHPEGGWYRQTYKSHEGVEAMALPKRFAGNRAFSTAIYFLLAREDFSAFHRLKSDECWHFYAGDPLEVFIIDQYGELKVVTLGSQYEKGHYFQYVIPANCWFASRPAPGSEYCFAGCTVAPGFEFDDFEIADADTLSARYPKHRAMIQELSR